MKLKLFLVALLLIPIATALPCSKTAHPSMCEEVMASSIPSEEKQWLVTELLQDHRDFPNYNFVYGWNTAVDTSTPPDGIKKYSNGFIKDAWLKLLAVMPSVLENNTLYINDSGSLLSAYNHRIEIPPDYRSPGYPTTKNGDCATYYSLVEHTAHYAAYINDKCIGFEHLVNYTTQEDSEFRGVYDILLRTDIEHWNWNKYCCAKTKKGKCKSYCYSCDYRTTEHKTDQVVVKDQFNAEKYNVNMSAGFTLIDNQTNGAVGLLQYQNVSSLRLRFAESNFSEYNYAYTLNRSIPPLDILTVKAEKVNRKTANNLNLRGNNTYTIVLQNISNCTLDIQSHFSSKLLTCNTSSVLEDPFISTDKISYDNNETIHVIITPQIEYNLSYAEKNYTVNGAVSLKAEFPYNRISIFVKGKEISKIINVTNAEPLNFLFSISIFGGMNYLLMGVIRKLWGGLL